MKTAEKNSSKSTRRRKIAAPETKSVTASECASIPTNQTPPDDGRNDLLSRLGAIQARACQQRILEASRAAYRILYEDLPRLLELEKKLKAEIKMTAPLVRKGRIGERGHPYAHSPGIDRPDSKIL